MEDKKNIAKRFRAKLYEMWARFTPIKEDAELKSEIIYNGENYLYPYEVERVINNSPTAFRSAMMMSKFISGKGLVNPAQDIVINSEKNYKLSNIIEMASEDIAYHRGVFIHLSFEITIEGGEFVAKPYALDVLDYVDCRKAAADSEGNKGKICKRDFKAVSKFGAKKDKEKSVWYYPFNKNQSVILAQIKADAGIKDGEEVDYLEAIKSYRGQVYYLNLFPRYEYSLSPIDSVYNDADTENRFSIYTNSQFRTGFLGKTIFLTQGLDEEAAEKEGEKIAKFLGSEDSGDVYHLDVAQTDNLDTVLKVIQLKGQFDDKLFVEADKRVRKNILGAFNNIPEPLVAAGLNTKGKVLSGATSRLDIIIT